MLIVWRVLRECSDGPGPARCFHNPIRQCGTALIPWWLGPSAVRGRLEDVGFGVEKVVGEDEGFVVFLMDGFSGRPQLYLSETNA